MNKKSVGLVLALLIGCVFIVNGVILADQTITIQSPRTVGVLPVLWMEENGIMGEDIKLDVTLDSNLQQMVPLIAKGDIDMMVTGVNVGAKVFNKGIDVRLLNTNIWAIDYLLTHGFKADDWEDLKGKELSLPLKGGPLDFLARYFLLENNVNPDKVDFIYNPLSSGAKLFQLGKLDSVILPEPLVTISLKKAKDAYLSIDLQKEWAKLHNGEDRIPYVGLFVRGDYADNNQQLTEEFNKYYKEGVKWVNNNPEEAAALAAEKFDMPAGIIKSSFDRVNLNCYPAAESYQLIDMYFDEIMEIYPEMIGGRKPNELFYF